MNDVQVITELKNGNREVLEKIYLNNKGPFFRYCNRFDLQEEDLRDVYQDVIIIVYENIQKGKLDDLKSTLRTYILSVGKYQIYNRFKKNAKTYNPEKDTLLDGIDNSFVKSFDLDSVNKQRHKLIMKNFKLLGEKCREILSMFYLKGFSLDEIMSLQGYNSMNVVKSQKSRCLKSLKDLIKGNAG